jgi:hypothetical protein
MQMMQMQPFPSSDDETGILEFLASYDVIEGSNSPMSATDTDFGLSSS